jgi:hypothetical protein
LKRLYNIILYNTMGFFDRVKAIGGWALSIGGSALKDFGDIGTEVVRNVGSLASPIQGIIYGIGSLIPRGGSVANIVNHGINALASHGAHKFVGKIDSLGQKPRSCSESMNY